MTTNTNYNYNSNANDLLSQASLQGEVKKVEQFAALLARDPANVDVLDRALKYPLDRAYSNPGRSQNDLCILRILLNALEILRQNPEFPFWKDKSHNAICASLLLEDFKSVLEAPPKPKSFFAKLFGRS